MSDETKIFTKNDKNGDKCASGGQESGLKLIFERGVAILVRPWRFPGQPKKFVFFSIKVGTINSGTSLDSREQFKKTGKLEISRFCCFFRNIPCCQRTAAVSPAVFIEGPAEIRRYEEIDFFSYNPFRQCGSPFHSQSCFIKYEFIPAGVGGEDLDSGNSPEPGGKFYLLLRKCGDSGSPSAKQFRSVFVFFSLFACPGDFLGA